MKLEDYFSPQSIHRHGSFSYLFYPFSQNPGGLCYAENSRFLKSVNDNNNISAVITTSTLSSLVHQSKALIVHEDPKLAYFELHNLLFSDKSNRLFDKPSIHPQSKIASSAIISEFVRIDKNVEIGHGTVINDYTVIGENTKIKENVIIGTKGLQDIGLKADLEIEYAGGVRIGKNCEILASAIIQKPYQFIYTEIKDNTQISVKASIGHGTVIGPNTMVAGNTQIAGHCQIGSNVWIGPSSTIANSIIIENEAQVKIGSVVVKNVGIKGNVSGNFAYPHKQRLKNMAKLSRNS